MIPEEGAGSWTSRSRSARCPRPAATPQGRVRHDRRARRRSGRSSRARSPTRAARCATTPSRRPGISNLIEIMAVATGDDDRRIEARYDGARLRRLQGGRSARRSSRCSTPIQERYEALRADEPSSERLLARRRREGPRGVAPRRSSGCTSAWASSARRAPRTTTAPPKRGRGLELVCASLPTGGSSSGSAS